MSFFLFILIIIVLLFGWPLLRGWLYMQRLKKNVNDIFGRGNNQQQQRRGYQDDDDDDGKIFDSTDGEYADFEEVRGAVFEETTVDSDTGTIIEEQITDAEYEEIP